MLLQAKHYHFHPLWTKLDNFMFFIPTKTISKIMVANRSVAPSRFKWCKLENLPQKILSTYQCKDLIPKNSNRGLKGDHQGGIGSGFPRTNSAISQNPVKTFDFLEFSSSSCHRVFCSRLKALLITVTIEQLLKKIVPWCNMGLPGDVESNFREKISELFVHLPNRKIKTLSVSWA